MPHAAMVFPPAAAAAVYALGNICSATGIVFANKTGKRWPLVSHSGRPTVRAQDWLSGAHSPRPAPLD